MINIVATAIGRRAFALGLAILAVPFAARASDYASLEEVMTMARKVANLLREKGLDATIADLSKQPGAVRDRDLYVFIVRDDGVMMFHGASPALVGKNVIDLKDVTGFALNRSIVAVSEEGWVDYHWPNPVTNTIQAKTTHVVAVGPYRVAVGAYKS